MAMAIEELAGIIGALADLAWPLLAGVVLWRLWPTILKIANDRAFRLKVGMMEISAQDATEQLRRSVGDLQRTVGELGSRDPSEDVRAEARPRLPRPRLAWVDDVPENNAYEIARLREDGVRILEMSSTEDAVRALVEEGQPVDVVISDMGRLEGGVYNGEAGLQLIRALRAGNFKAPIYVYCSSESVERMRAEIRHAGAQGITSSQMELFGMLHREGVL